MKKRMIPVILLVAATTVIAVLAQVLGINPPIQNIAGAYVSIVVVCAAARIFKVTDQFFNMGLVFVFFAVPVGSVLNFYRSVGPYDKIVHFVSGILLAMLGVMIMKYILKKCGLAGAEDRQMILPAVVFGIFFAGAGAGIWEIFEFTADKLAGGGMQRGMTDTITDMIAGICGALIYGAAGILFGGISTFSTLRQKNGKR